MHSLIKIFLIKFVWKRKLHSAHDTVCRIRPALEIFFGFDNLSLTPSHPHKLIRWAFQGLNYHKYFLLWRAHHPNIQCSKYTNALIHSFCQAYSSLWLISVWLHRAGVSSCLNCLLQPSGSIWNLYQGTGHGSNGVHCQSQYWHIYLAVCWICGKVEQI